MFNKAKKFVVSVALIAGLAVLSTAVAHAAPYRGKIYHFKQPDSTTVEVKVYGDEFYSRMESTDGYSLIRDPESNWICYADLNKDCSEYVSTGIAYKGDSYSAEETGVNLEKSLKINQESIDSKVSKVKEERKWDEQLKNSSSASNENAKSASSSSSISEQARYAATDDSADKVTALTILIDFPKEKGTISRDTIDEALNSKVSSYFDYYSGGKFKYDTIVTDYFTASHEKKYYDTTVNGGKPGKLIEEALNDLKDKNFDFSQLTVDPETKVVRSLNILYAGEASNGMDGGLWPHKSSIKQYKVDTVNGPVIFETYQITDITQKINIGTFIHESCHAIFGWPDTYDDLSIYGGSAGVKDFDIMSNCDTKEPLPINPYFRNIYQGWGTNVKLNNYKDGEIINITPNSIDCHYFVNAASKEYFILESIKKTGRYKSMPGNGLLIWRVDKDGFFPESDATSNISIDNAELSVVQADGKFDLENNVNGGDKEDFFGGANSRSFGPDTIPNSNWFNPNNCFTFSLTDINDDGTQCTFNRVMPWDLTNSGITTADDLSSSSEPGYHAFDNNLNTKWIVMNSSASIKYELKDNQKVVLKSYSISSSDGPSESDPRTWKLKGSNDNIVWYDIDNKLQEIFSDRNQTKTYNVDNNKEYKYYWFEFKNNSGDTLQLSEIQIFGDLYDTQKIFASGGYTSDGNGMDKAFDNDSSTKWSVYQNPGNAGWITYNFNKPVNVTNYTIISADSDHKRDPKDWKFYASDDNFNWVLLDTENDFSFENFSQRKYFSANNNKAYKYYKLVVESTNSSPVLEIAEIELLNVSSKDKDNSNVGNHKAFDSDNETKWVSSNTEDKITIQYMNPVVIRKYSIVSACKNDDGVVEKDRNPKSWELRASNDNINWDTVLSTIDGKEFNSACKKKTFHIDNTTPYLYYRLEIKENNGGDSLQIGEIELN